MQLILILIGTILAAAGVLMVYDARIFTKKLFGFGDQNEAACGFKILGFFVAMIGGFMIFFNM